jgi:hypothetical protein
MICFIFFMKLSQSHDLDNVFFELTRLDSNHFIVFFL